MLTKIKSVYMYNLTLLLERMFTKIKSVYMYNLTILLRNDVHKKQNQHITYTFCCERMLTKAKSGYNLTLVLERMFTKTKSFSRLFCYQQMLTKATSVYNLTLLPRKDALADRSVCLRPHPLSQTLRAQAVVSQGRSDQG